MSLKTAVVTGASGYVASEIIAQLLHKGYAVKATVRDASNTAKVRHLRRLAEAFAGEVTFHEAELGKPGAFDGIVKGARIVFHCAAECNVETFPEEAEARQRLINKALDSQLDIIRAAAASRDTVKRVVITSSIAAVKPFTALRHKPWCEEDWNTPAVAKEALENDPYAGLKTLTEMKSYELAKELGVSLSSIVPSFVVGPVLSENLGFTPTAVKNWLEGGGDAMWMATAVDVRDVARAHILAAEKGNGEGRFLVARSHPLPPSSVVEALRNHLPEYKIDEANHSKVGYYDPTFQIFDTSKVEKELGLQFTDVRESSSDMVVSMLRKGMLNFELAGTVDDTRGTVDDTRGTPLVTASRQMVLA